MQAWLRPVFARDDILRGEKTQLCTQPRNSRTPRCPPPSLPFPRLHPPSSPHSRTDRTPLAQFFKLEDDVSPPSPSPLLLLSLELVSNHERSSDPRLFHYSILLNASLREKRRDACTRDKWRGGKILTVRIVSREDDTSDHSGFDWQNRAYPFPQIKERRGKGVEINRGSPRRMASNYGGLERGR